MNLFRLTKPQHGWIDIAFGFEFNCYTLTVSDVPNDCLRDLAAATARLLAGASDEMVEFSLEPHFARCELHRDLDSVRVIIIHPDHESPVFAETFLLRAFAQRLRLELLRIQTCYSSEDGWTQPFPHDEIAKLAQARGA